MAWELRVSSKGEATVEQAVGDWESPSQLLERPSGLWVPRGETLMHVCAYCKTRAVLARCMLAKWSVPATGAGLWP